MFFTISDLIMKLYYFVVACFISVCATVLYYMGYDPDEGDNEGGL